MTIVTYHPNRTSHPRFANMGSVGVLFLLLFIGLLIYFVGGVVIMKLRGASGLELIPNYMFWISLPSKLKVKVV